jgi:hypothetical protein
MFMFAGLNEAQIREMIRHECGHVVVGRALSFPPGDITLDKDGAGANSEHNLSLPSIVDACEYIKKRLQVLYAGAIAQSLDESNKTQRQNCRRFLETTAANDMAKIRELSRVLAGMTDPGLSNDNYAKKLATNAERFSEEAVTIVEANALLIKEMVESFILGLKENVKGAATLSRVPLTSYKFSSARIDALIANRPIIIPIL